VTCPSESQLQDFVEGRSTAEERAHVSNHLDTCGACRRTVAEAARSRPVAEPTGRQTFGRYEIERTLGRGAMATVYAAKDTVLRRTVALKILTRGKASPDAERLALREAQAMARLTHPNVVRIYDAGTVGDEVFLSMELVDGATLAQWLDRAPRSWRAVLAVMAGAGRGLAAAHEVGIIHRDFKPANVLVDGAEQARVADFGLAHATLAEASSRASASSPLTATTVSGTPAYMAPEQLDGQPPSALTDQFSFCVTLFEALYGVRPFAGATLAELAEAERTGRIQIPARRAQAPTWIWHALVRGLSARSSERHRSMAELTGRLEKGLSARKWRPLAAAAAGALVAAGLAQGLAWRHQRAQLCRGGEKEWAATWSPAAQDKAHGAFVATRLPFAERAWQSAARALDAYGRDWMAMDAQACEATRIRGAQSEEVLDLRMACLSNRRREALAVADLLGQADAQVVGKAGQIASGLAPVASCADVEALKAPLRLPADPDLRARVDAVRSQLARAKAMEGAGKYSEAIPIAEGAVAAAPATRFEPVEAEALARLGATQMLARRDEPALASLQKAFYTALGCKDDPVAQRAATLLVEHVGLNLAKTADADRWAQLAASLAARDPDDAPLSRLRTAQGLLLEAEGKFPGALDALRQAQSIDEHAAGARELDLAETRNRIAKVLTDLGKLPEAALEARAALQIRERLLGPDHPDVADSHNNLGRVLYQQGIYEEALAEFRKGLAIRERVFGKDHPLVAGSHNNIGAALNDVDRHAEALAEYRIALDIQQRSLGPDHPDVAQSHNNIAGILMDDGKPEEALVEMRQALAIRERAFGPDHPEVAYSHSNLGLVLATLGRHEDALVELRLALHQMEKSLGPTHEDLGSLHTNIAASLLAQGHADAAIAEFRRGLELRLGGLGPDNLKVADSHERLGSALAGQHRYAEALLELKEGLRVEVKQLGEGAPDSACTLGDIGQIYVEQHRWAEAVDALTRTNDFLAKDVADGTAHVSPQNLAESHFALARALWGAGRERPRAIELARRARDEYARIPLFDKELRHVDAWLTARGTRLSQAP
jgi:tetratricopeptide (TPR) repeat protein